jgi:AcrR family transcriptional regulator
VATRRQSSRSATADRLSRRVARRAGVTHTAATYHFGEKAGLLAAVAAEGYRLLADALLAASQRSFLEMGVAYVRFAIATRAHFEVMSRPGLYDPADPAVQAAKQETAALLFGSAMRRPSSSLPASPHGRLCTASSPSGSTAQWRTVIALTGRLTEADVDNTPTS